MDSTQLSQLREISLARTENLDKIRELKRSVELMDSTTIDLLFRTGGKEYLKVDWAKINRDSMFIPLTTR